MARAHVPPLDPESNGGGLLAQGVHYFSFDYETIVERAHRTMRTMPTTMGLGVYSITVPQDLQPGQRVCWPHLSADPR